MADDPDEIAVVQAAIEKLIIDSGYSRLIPNLDQHCKDLAVVATEAAEGYRNGKQI